MRSRAPTSRTARAATAITPAAIANLSNCIADARQAALDGDPGPADPQDFTNLRGRLAASRDNLPPLYRETFFDPYVATVNGLGPAGFNTILLTDPNTSLLMMDIAHAILQNGEGFQAQATDAFQEVVSDLYDGFLSAEDRVGVKEPDLGVIPPLVKWGHPDFGPYTFPIEATSSFRLSGGTGLGAALVSLPPANARLGLFAWPALGHETAGHDILSADIGLKAEISRIVRTKVRDAGLSRLAGYWAARIDETASDVLGILNMGPAAGIGLIGFFRGLNDAFGGEPQLRNNGPANDSHPADVLRGFLASATVKFLSFNGSSDWADAILTETMKDVTTIRLEGAEVSTEDAARSAELVADAIVNTELVALENHAIGEIQDWRNQDEEIVTQLQEMLVRSAPLPSTLGSGIFAAHAVAAGVMAALTQEADIALIFRRMLGMLKAMHDANPSWGPLFIAHPGDVKLHRAFSAAV